MRKTREVLCAAAIIMVLLLAQTGQAEEAEYGPLWSYEAGDRVYDVSISSDGSYIAAGSYDDKVYLFDREGELLWSYKAGDGVRGVSISSDGSYIAAGSGDDKVYLFDREGELLWSYEAGDGVRGVSISSDGSYIAAGSGGADDKVYLFDREGELLWSYEAGGIVRGVSISSDGSYIAAGSGGDDNKVYLFDSIKKRGYTTRQLMSGGDDNKVYLFDREGELLWSYEAGGIVRGVSISSDGSYIAAVSGRDDKVYLFDREGELLWSYEAGDGVWGVSISSDGSYIAAGYSGKVYFFANLEKVFSAIEEANKAIKVEKGSGFKMNEAETLLSSAEDAFGSGDFSRATDLAKEAKYKAESIVKEASAAMTAIGAAENTVKSEKSKSLNVSEAESLLSQAEDAFGSGDYAKVRELANRAKSIALDVDHDGTPNDADFAPTIDNYHIYGAVFIFLVGLTLTSLAGLNIRARRIRAEEEKRRKEEAERQRRREEIQRILDKIKEVT